MNYGIQNMIDAVVLIVLKSGLIVSTCTIQLPRQGEAGIGPSGAPVGAYDDVVGLINLRCMDAPQPPSEIKLGAESIRAAGQVTDIAPRHCWLAGFYPVLLDTKWRYGARAVITTTRRGVTHVVTYEICGAEADSQQTQTRMELKLVSAGAVQA